MTKPHILITNDDGIHAPGIRHLWEAIYTVADVTIIAPNTEKSGTGLAITLHEPIWTEKVEWPENTTAWSVHGTPADCVKLGVTVLLNRRPDLIISGINRGSNAGRNLLYSGTVGGVIEAAMQDIPGIAVSCCEYLNPDYAMAGRYIPKLINHILQHPLPKGTFLNVNFPHTPDIKGIKLARQGKEFWKENPTKPEHPSERSDSYWLGAKTVSYEEHVNSDISWLNQGYAAAVPVHAWEMTDHDHLRNHQVLFDSSLS